MNSLKLNIFFVAVLSIFLYAFNNKSQEIKKHLIKVVHPGISKKDSIACVLFETKENFFQEKQFFMDLETVICGDKQCKIDVVRIYWDQFGDYLKLELLNGVKLEKAKGEYFIPADYEKLDKILKDSGSPLKEVYKNEIVSNSSGEGFDAVSGETILLKKEAYVKGAVWTCYTLWHWVYGNARNKIRNITGKAYSSLSLNNLLKSSIESQHQFALEQLIRKKDFSDATKVAVKNYLLKHPNSTKKGIDFFKESSLEKVSSIILELYKKSNVTNRVLYFKLIEKRKHQISKGFFEKLFEFINQNPSFQEINLFLKIIKNDSILTSSFSDKLIQLLEQKDILVSRKIYWFLNEQKLNSNQKNKLNIFYKKYKDKL